MKNICCGGKCKKLRHHRTSQFCFECGEKLIKKPYQWSFQYFHSLIILVPLIGFGGPIGISSCIQYQNEQEVILHKQIELLPEEWQTIYYLVVSVSIDQERALVFEKVVVDDLPKLTPENIHFLMSLFHYNHNKIKAASKLMEFRK